MDGTLRLVITIKTITKLAPRNTVTSFLTSSFISIPFGDYLVILVGFQIQKYKNHIQ